MKPKVSDDGFVRDPDTNAVLNTNAAGYQAYKQNRQTTLTNKQLNEKVLDLTNELNEIKQLLRQLIAKE